MASPEQQIDFLSKMQRLLAEGSFVATYKYALLLALADLCVELGRDDDAVMEISTRDIGEKFMEYYWRQAAPYLPVDISDSGLLQQNSGASPKIIKLLWDLRGAYGESLEKLRRDERVWNRTITKVTAHVRKMPLWKLQTVGEHEKLDFLYENTGSGDLITLRPGVAFCFRKHHSLVVDLVKWAWAQRVRHYNADRLAEKADLHEFLFGSERANLGLMRSILTPFQQGRCFYCGNSMRDDAGHVDHFIPWVRYPVDLGHNFVLAHSSCNERKSDHLPAVLHLNAWVEHNREFGAPKAREFERLGVLHDLTTSTRIMNWAYRQTSQFKGLTWLRGRELEPLPVDWDRSLATLFN